MAVEHIDRYLLVSEPEAAVTYLQATGELGSNTAVFYDLGDAGLTVTVVDLVSREVLAERTDSIGGRVFDNVIRDHQLDTNGVWRPDDPATDDELSAQCREAKEKLSQTRPWPYRARQGSCSCRARPSIRSSRSASSRRRNSCTR